ncbi:uncharacterized protein TOT_040000793 [Theileria orientalis strain Shintoku]|uniref:Rab-GAP TBC domain-containing protein n=1 Tax=Theileria orientalis strain Shintoku TaxID=869250 RepID=J7MGZ9_THEOR|nr:uncharacterized protein TOT_040000793 [Theileria orientalis strain Shintoku]BAM42426.1 uncharacterized protein TOT_040000793 [Theileria orientalis strain Shintoku]|eukprot:XP_009692727.1 uncharacterized protein TOT_040000793 [Theileria orientalis strain Shintoku]
MLLRQEKFLERERNSPLFNRCGLKRDTDVLMLLPKFRHILRLVRLNKSRIDNGTNGTTTVNRGVSITSTSTEAQLAALKKSDTNTTTDTTTVGKETKLEDLADALGKLKVESKGESSTETVEMRRIFRLDAERTFLHQAHRDIFFENLCHVYDKLGDYHQGEGFVIALLSIYMKDDEIAEVMDYLNTHVLTGYFSSKPRAYVRDAKVLMKLLNEVAPKLHDKLDSLIVPEAFVSKWFIGLFIHVFDFETVLDCMDSLVVRGQLFLFKLGLSFIRHHEAELLGTNDVSYALQLLRLDDAVIPKDDVERSEIYRAILGGASQQDVDMARVERLRVEVEEEMAREEERRKKFEYDDYDDEIVFSDEE